MYLPPWGRILRRWLAYVSRGGQLLALCGLVTLALLALCHWMFPLPPEVFRLDFSKVYYDRHGQLLGARLSADEKWRFEGRLHRVSPYLVAGLLEFEDKRFYRHYGIDPVAGLRAAWQNLATGRIVSGASTLTMQVARLLSRQKRYGTLGGKLVQVFRAVQLEWSLSKEAILELYFNLAPYGGNIEGATAASWFYFGKPPSEVNWTEAIALAIAPKSPNRYRPDRFVVAARRHCERLTDALRRTRQLSEEDRWFVDCTTPPGGPHPLPTHARHLVDRVHTGSDGPSSLIEHADVARPPTWNHVRLTIDLGLQQRVERIVSGYLQELKGVGVRHAAAIVIENTSGEVLAYVGSPHFDDKEDGGEVDGVRAPRSPGSTLKPFLYARALESGEYTPQTLLANVPVKYQGYRPQNFTPTELGVVTFATALQQSLNLPAVALNIRLGKAHDLLAFLWEAGVSTLGQSRDHYGQSMVLGGGEMRLDELATQYATLARSGWLRPTRLVLPEDGHVASPAPRGRALLSPAASFIISEILRQAPLPEYATGSRFFHGMPDVAWKTGTSGRRRDAWTLGYNPRYTVGVWLGNFSGDPVEQMTGRSTAAPLFFRIFRELPGQGEARWPAPPDQVVEQTVCSLSGHLPTASCPTHLQTWWIAGVTKPTFCQLHIQLLLDRRSGRRLSPECIRAQGIPSSEIEPKPAILWPRETGGWLARTGSTLIFPPFADGCEPRESVRGLSPLLQTPLDGEHYIIRIGEAPRPPFASFDTLVFSAAVSNEVNQLEWFLDGQKLATTKPGETLLWTPQLGEHRLIVVDDFGRAAQARFQVHAE